MTARIVVKNSRNVVFGKPSTCLADHHGSFTDAGVSNENDFSHGRCLRRSHSFEGLRGQKVVVSEALIPIREYSAKGSANELE